MSDHVYKLIELTGTSTTGIEDAVSGALARAAKTVRHMRWFEVTDTRGAIKDGRIDHWQVTVKVGFTLDDPA
jgi:flavin-binding protein dodecin